MARFGNGLYFIALLYFTEIFSNAVSQTEEEMKEIYICMRRQICECEGGADNYKRCYSFLKKKTDRWFLGVVSECDLGTINTFDDVVNIMCALPRDEFFVCFLHMEREVRKKTMALSRSPLEYDEFVALESTRACCIPNLSICADNPDECF